MAAQTICRDIDDGIVCKITGELDLVAEAEVTNEIAASLEKRPARLILDLSELEFIDSTGLRVLLTARNRAGENSTRLLLASPTDAVKRVLEIANVTQVFEYVDDIGNV